MNKNTIAIILIYKSKFQKNEKNYIFNVRSHLWAVFLS